MPSSSKLRTERRLGSRKRNSAHELLRIVAMFIIVWYHMVLYYLYSFPHDPVNDYLIEAVLPLFHIGVILFVLLSGYYGIKPSVRGLLKLVIIVFVYCVPLSLADLYMSGDICHPTKVIKALQIITHTPYWFIRAYIYLYLLSPIVNAFLQHVTNREKNIMLLVSAAIAVYAGTTQQDISLAEGKNVVNFIFLYLLGNAIHRYQPTIERVKSQWIILAWVSLNVLLITLLIYFPTSTYIGKQVWRMSFPYCSPILIFNASLVFMLFTKLRFHSKVINSIAASTLAVYLIQEHPFIHDRVIMPMIGCMDDSPYPYLVLSFLAAICIMVVCVIIDKAFTPLWRHIK